MADAEEARKQHPFDFALWKGAKPGEPSFPSPWGEGRPGWHIECSAMVRAELGDTIDIHLGGCRPGVPAPRKRDCPIGSPPPVTTLAKLWMHNGMVNVGGTKMPKSLGNFTTIRALLDAEYRHDTAPVCAAGPYRKPLDFTTESLEAAATGWKGG
ncbi:MAG: hypothetical protein CM15mP77_2960 [Synechococcus sp.]|nr:MAG: hypothetical protein CM15mP77_2960 [Synechococcus sp.]